MEQVFYDLLCNSNSSDNWIEVIVKEVSQSAGSCTLHIQSTGITCCLHTQMMYTTMKRW
jgi:hypothetical protein